MRKALTWVVAAALLAGYLVISRAPDTVAAVSSPSPLVVIDPGHGGWDPGAVRGDVYEKSLTLAVAMKLGAWLQQRGIRVYYTRTRDTALSSTVLSDLNQRAALANRLGGTVLVSIHVNTESTGTMAGPIVYYNGASTASYSLASRVSQSLRYLNGHYRQPRPIRQWVLAWSRMPAINVEIGFLSHGQDARNMQSSPYQQQLADHIGRGVSVYLGR